MVNISWDFETEKKKSHCTVYIGVDEWNNDKKIIIIK